MSMQQTMLKSKLLAEDIPFISGKSEHIKIDNNLSFKKIVIVHKTGVLSGGSTGDLIPDTILDNIRVFINNKISLNLVGDVDTDLPPYAIQLLKQINKLKNKVADTAEFFPLDFPTPQRTGTNSYIDFRFNTIANVNDGDRTTYTGTIDIQILYHDVAPARPTELDRNAGKEPFGAKTGRLPFFINPTQVGFTAMNLMLFGEDDGTPDLSKISKIEVLKGGELIHQGTPAQLREIAQSKWGIAPDAGFIWLPIRRPVGANDLQVFVTIPSSGTDVELHWLLTSIK